MKVSDAMAKGGEAALQARLIDALHLTGWQVAHFRPALTQRGWRTPVSADGAGFPDILAVRKIGEPQMMALECKSARGKLSEAQRYWLFLFARLPGCTVRVVTPDTEAEVLRLIGLTAQ